MGNLRSLENEIYYGKIGGSYAFIESHPEGNKGFVHRRNGLTEGVYIWGNEIGTVCFTYDGVYKIFQLLSNGIGDKVMKKIIEVLDKDVELACTMICELIQSK